MQNSRAIGTEMFQGYPDVLNLEEMSELLQISTKTGRRTANNQVIAFISTDWPPATAAPRDPLLGLKYP